MAFGRKSFSTPKTMEPAKALLRLEELCSKGEHCEYELRQKLKRWLVSPEDSDTIISSLKRRRFLDDTRYAHAFVRDKVEFGRWGKRKIQLAMFAKHIDRSIINEVLDEIDMGRYQQNLRDILATKARSMDDARTYDGRTRLYRFAAARGYEPELISKILRTDFRS